MTAMDARGRASSTARVTPTPTVQSSRESEVKDEVKAALAAWDEFAMGVGLFAPQLLNLPAFMKLYDAMQDLHAVELEESNEAR